MCPECGSSYDARAWAPKNIFDPSGIRFPSTKLVQFLICLGCTLCLLTWCLTNSQSWNVVFGLIFSGFSIVFGKQLMDGISDYRRRAALKEQLTQSLPRPGDASEDNQPQIPPADSSGGLAYGSRKALGLNISSHWFCAACGQSLYDKPRVGTCSSCDTHYDSRHSTRRNIFDPRQADIDWADLLFASLFLGVLIVIFILAMLPAPKGIVGISIRVFMGLVAIFPFALFVRFAKPFLAAIGNRRRHRHIWKQVTDYRAHRPAEAPDASEEFSGFAQSGTSVLGKDLPFEGLEHSVHCGQCGYSLHKAARAGTCPECGHRYDADPLKMSGVFLPGDAPFPLLDIILTIFAAVLGLRPLVSGIRHHDLNEMVMGIVFTLLGLGVGMMAWRKLSRFRHEYKIAKRINEQNT
jgi:rubrerythrin